MKTYRFYLLPNPTAKRLYLKSIDCDTTLNPLEAKIFTTKTPKNQRAFIRSRLIRKFDADIEYSLDPKWNNLDAKNIQIKYEIVPRDELEVMKTGRWKKILA